MDLTITFDNDEYINFYSMEVDLNYNLRNIKETGEYNEDGTSIITGNRSINYEYLVCPMIIDGVRYRKSVIYINNNKRSNPTLDLRTCITEYFSEEVFSGFVNFLLKDRENSCIFMYDDMHDRYFNIFYDNEFIRDYAEFKNWWNMQNDPDIRKLDVDPNELHKYYINKKANTNIYTYSWRNKSHYEYFEMSEYCN